MRYSFKLPFPQIAGPLAAVLLVTACAQQPAAPAKPAPAAPAPAAPAASPAAAAAAKPAESPAAAAPAKPAASPAAAPAAAPTASPATAPAAKPAASPAAAPQAKPATPVDTKAIADFYQGKTVRIIVGFAAGGGYDTYGRLVARFLGKHIPGNPTVIVENMPGAGSLLAANTVYKTSAKDGTIIAHFIGGMITQKVIVENPAVEFDPEKYNWLGGPTPDTAACAVRKESGFTSLNEARTKELVLGGTAPGSTTDDIPNTLKAIGLNIKMVDGYDGTSRIRLAADSGEVMGGCWGWESISVTWKDALASGDVKVLAQGGPRPHPELQGVPMMQDVAQTEEQKQLVQAGIVAPGQISRGFAVAPEVPADRVQALRTALMATLNDPELKAEADKAGIAINPVPAEEFYARIKDLQDLPPALKQKLKAAVGGG
jgi:tripartite-type tricarboxylate transporter receptor subunit TctC